MDRKHFFAVALALLLLLTGAGIASAQDGLLEGRVTREDGTPLGGVSVRIDQLDQVTVTDEGGSFAFSGVPAGTYDLTFSLLDYTATETGVQVAAGGTQTVDKALDWDVSFAETITVTSVSRRAERDRRGAGGGDGRHREGDRARGVDRPGPEAPGVHPRRRLHPERPLRLQLQHPRLQQLAQPAHPDADRRPRPGGAVPRRAGVGGGLVPDGRALQRRAGARPRLGALRRQRLQRRAQHDHQGAARQRGRPDPPDRRRARTPGAATSATPPSIGNELLLQGRGRLHAERRLHSLAQPHDRVLGLLRHDRARPTACAARPPRWRWTRPRSASAACASTSTSPAARC